ncbi:MAG: preprotein translocase subunit SecG [Elusimicrobiota bacterium]
MYTFLLTIHIFACVALILVVLLQAGRGAGFAIFGGGGDALFASPSGSSFLKQATTILAGTFAVTSLMLTLLSSRIGMKSVTQAQAEVPAPPGQSAPVVPGQVPPKGPPMAPPAGSPAGPGQAPAKAPPAAPAPAGG